MKNLLLITLLALIAAATARAQMQQLGGTTGSLDGSVGGTSGIASTSTVATDQLGSPAVVKASGTNVILPFLTNTVLAVDGAGVISATTVATLPISAANGGTGLDASSAANGSLFIGNGAGVSLANMLGTENQVQVINGAGSITLQTPQDTHSTASPTFTGMTLSGLTASQLVKTNGSSALVSATSVNLSSEADGILSAQYGGTGIDGSAAANGSIPIGNGSGYSLSTITGTSNQVNVTNGAGSITLSLPQDIHTGASPTFLASTSGDLQTSGNTISALTANAGITLAPNGTGKVTIASDLDVAGTLTQINQTQLDVVNPTIIVNSTGSQAWADANDAGLIVEMTDATDAQIGYDSTCASRFISGEIGSLICLLNESSSQTFSNKTGDFVVGSAANPSIYFGGDSDSGLFHSAADTLNMSAGGAEIAEFDGAGINFAVPFVGTQATLTTSVVTGGATHSYLGASSFVRTNGSSQLTSATSVQLGSQVDGILPIARGGTNSSAALVNGRVMRSNAGAIIESSVTLDANGDFTGIRSQDLTPIAAPAHSEGLLFYDNSTNALAYYNDEADILIHVGRDTHRMVRNTTGSTITKGQIVYISGAQSNNPLITLATASSAAQSHVVGMADHDIEHNTNGYVITDGEIMGVNTLAFTAGDELYLSDTTPGAFTNVAPLAPSQRVSIGTVTRSHASLGEIVLHIENQAEASYSTGAIPFGNGDAGLSQDVANFYWDNTAKALGIGSQPHASAVLSASSVSKGFLPPRMTQAQRDAISSPAAGLMVFNTDANKYSLYDGAGWVSVQSGAVDLASDVSGILQPANGGTGVDGSSATNGQMLIGDGSGYAQAFLTGTANQVNVTNGAGSVTLSTPQDIHLAASPTFANATFTDLTASEFVRTAADGKLESASSVQLGSQVDGILSAQYGGVGIDGSAAANGSLPIGNGAGYSLATITGTANQVDVTNGAGSITLSGPQDLDIAASPTFANATFTDLSPSQLVETDSNGNLVSATSIDLGTQIDGILGAANGGSGLDASAAGNGSLLIGNGSGFSLANILGTENQVTVVDSAGGITLSAPQDLHSTATPTFADLTVSNLSASQFVKTDGSSQLASATSVLLGSEVDGILPVANGGTNSDAALNNNRMMISSGGAIVEHSAQTQGQVFFGDANGLPAGDTNLQWDNTAKALGVGGAADASAALDVTSTTKGLLPPRMSTAQRDLIGAPAEGLMIYNTTLKQPQYYNGSIWISY